MQRTGRKLAFLAGVTLAVTACPQRTAVWIEPGATTRNLVFHLSDRRHGTAGLNSPLLRIERCSVGPGTAEPPLVWGAYVQADTPVRWMRYGEFPPGSGALADQGPAPAELPPRCYVAHTNGTGLVAFDVLDNGTVREVRSDE